MREKPVHDLFFNALDHIPRNSIIVKHDLRLIELGSHVFELPYINHRVVEKEGYTKFVPFPAEVRPGYAGFPIIFCALGRSFWKS